MLHILLVLASACAYIIYVTHIYTSAHAPECYCVVYLLWQNAVR